MSEPENASAYAALESRFARISDIKAAESILSWDRSAVMPDGGATARGATMATLAGLAHEHLCAPEMAELISRAESEVAGDSWRAANIREMQRAYRSATAIPTDLVQALSLAESETEMAWRTARAEDNFALLAPRLERLLGLVREQAAALADGRDLSLYDALLDQYDPGRRAAEIDDVFAVLEAELPPLLEAVLDQQAASPPAIVPEGPFAQNLQKGLGEEVMALLGFDFTRGRLDESHHPFTGGLPDDSRITTRYDPDDFTSALMGVIHEAGHALYEQGLPRDWRQQPVGKSFGMTVHESQSLLFEMQAGRSPAFLAFLSDRVKARFNVDGDAYAPDNLVRLMHRVERGFIRVDADEVTYPLHVILRYRLERAMIGGDLKVADLPGAWQAGMVDLLGVTPPDDRLGCLQDIHWPSGAFGYFPTYTLGAIGAAQMFQAARAQSPALLDEIGTGRFATLLHWLRENVHEKGRLRLPGEIIVEATGRSLDPQALLSHLRARYLDGAGARADTSISQGE
ncbi:MAG: carboxypeptidase M32 [Pseudomonadota bacterium]